MFEPLKNYLYILYGFLAVVLIVGSIVLLIKAIRHKFLRTKLDKLIQKGNFDKAFRLVDKVGNNLIKSGLMFDTNQQRFKSHLTKLSLIYENLKIKVSKNQWDEVQDALKELLNAVEELNSPKMIELQKKLSKAWTKERANPTRTQLLTGTDSSYSRAKDKAFTKEEKRFFDSKPAAHKKAQFKLKDAYDKLPDAQDYECTNKTKLNKEKIMEKYFNLDSEKLIIITQNVNSDYEEEAVEIAKIVLKNGE